MGRQVRGCGFNLSRMRSPLLVVLFLAALQAGAQADSSGRGTIRISRPDIKAIVSASAEYAVYLKKSDAPKFGRIKGSRLRYIKSKDLRSFGQNEENPMPVIDKLYFSKEKGPRIIRQTDLPYDTVALGLGDTLVDLLDYFSSTVVYWYKFRDAPAVDTVQLRILIDRKGKYVYRFASKADSLNRTGGKCMEGLTSIRKWQPAHVFRTSDRKTNKSRRIRAYSEILLTVVLTTEDFAEGEEVTKKDNGTGQ
jgi:hypothetical protein